jgi:hypothetical protein
LIPPPALLGMARPLQSCPRNKFTGAVYNPAARDLIPLPSFIIVVFAQMNKACPVRVEGA